MNEILINFIGALGLRSRHAESETVCVMIGAAIDFIGEAHDLVVGGALVNERVAHFVAAIKPLSHKSGPALHELTYDFVAMLFAEDN